MKILKEIYIIPFIDFRINYSQPKVLSCAANAERSIKQVDSVVFLNRPTAYDYNMMR